jgi:hypothetical protein
LEKLKQKEVKKVVGLELCFVSVGSELEREYGRDTRVVDKDVSLMV